MKINIREMVLVSLFAALTAVGAFIRIPIPPVPVTLQLFFCCFSGMLLGSKLGALSQLIYMIIGLCGLPVFSGGGGITYIFQPSFGYIIGFVLAAYTVGKVCEQFPCLSIKVSLAAVMAGIAVIYIVGTAYLYIDMNFYLNKHISIMKAVYAGVLPFIVKDAALGVITAICGHKINTALSRMGYLIIN